ncbi:MULTISPECIES: imidazolonepropionase [Gammaproteobacteria]|uniref:imidazolonepropionase n=1 Tax=Gammaproteobacteria TaxID=1236 RepID=UPI000DD0313D|nr:MULTISPECIES: imidazolonepropionase [Gammaproteobacteria]RTE85902.1 imidazolonepropionase [Aliidiomarina sp. B3213]TCZ90098.1 imidazolonepropionase [Lysobacter sp. N42]
MPTLIENVTVATMQSSDNNPLGVIEHGALVFSQGEIEWVGPQSQLPDNYKNLSNRIDGEGQLLTPGLIDCHTHLVWGGNRANEFKQRLHGATYAEIAAAGGGIKSTVKATREASEEQLFEDALLRAEALIEQGVTTIEIKSGYGLNLEDELKQLRVARRLGKTLPARVVTTLLAAHALPPEYSDRADDYIDHVCNVIIPAAVEADLADAVDVFCETVGFTRQQSERVFEAAKAHGLPVKIHAEQLSDQDGAALMASFNGLSADHLEYLSQQGIEQMAKAGSVAVLLPGAFYFLRETKLPPIEALREAGVPIAIATDANPGSSPIVNLPLMMHFACTLFQLTPEEAWLGVTKHAAKALGQSDVGVLAKGYKADMALWNMEAPEMICYEFGVQRLTQRFASSSSSAA